MKLSRSLKLLTYLSIPLAICDLLSVYSTYYPRHAEHYFGPFIRLGYISPTMDLTDLTPVAFILGIDLLIVSICLFRHSLTSLRIGFTALLSLILLNIFFVLKDATILPETVIGIYQDIAEPSRWFRGIAAMEFIVIGVRFMQLILISGCALQVFRLLQNTKQQDQPHMKAVSSICSFLLIALTILGGYFVVKHVTYKPPPPKDPYGVPLTSAYNKAHPILTTSLTSPDKTYVLQVGDNSGGNPAYLTQIDFDLYDNTNTKFLGSTLYNISNDKAHGCEKACVIQFRGWVSNTAFTIQTIKDDKSVYTDIVNTADLIQYQKNRDDFDKK